MTLVHLVDLLRERARVSPDAPAFTFLEDGEAATDSLTFGALDREAQRLARSLRRYGVHGERVLLCHPPGIPYVVAFFGCLYAGAVAVPAFPPDPLRAKRTLPRLTAILGDSDAKLALTQQALVPIVEEAFTRRDGRPTPAVLGSDSLVALDERIAPWEPPALEADDLAFLMYTSGSTETPKGVMISHANALHNVTAFRGFDERHCRTFVSWLPLFHDLGLVVATLYPIYHGAHCVAMSPLAFMQRPMRWLRALSDYRATTTAGPNFAYDLCVERSRPDERAALDLRHLNLALNGAEPVRAETLERFLHAFAPAGLRREALYPAYGLSDATADASGALRFRPPTYLAVERLALSRREVVKAKHDKDAVTLVGCGEPLPQQQLRIVDPETKRPLPEGSLGEIWLSGPSIARGYFRRDALTAGAFGAKLSGETDDGRHYFHTGDLGFLQDGELFVLGRLDDMLILHGTNYFPEDIEPVVERCHPALRRGGGAVFGVDEGEERRLVVLHEVDETQLSDPDAVFRAIRRAVGEHHELEVGEIVLVAPGEVLKTSSGKVRRRACREHLAEGKLRILARSRLAKRPPDGDAGASPADASPPQRGAGRAEAIRAWIVRYFARRLEWPEATIDSSQPFTSFGLPSLEAVRLTADLGDWLGVSLPPTIAWDHPSIDRLARHLAQEPQTPAARRVDAPPPAQGEPIAIIGMACRFPGARSPAELWDLLREGRDSIREVPKDRWDIAALYHPDPSTPGTVASRWGGFVEDIDQFDARAFGMPLREAQQLDPRQRLSLELAWEALEDAGIPRPTLAGTSTGVFVASLTNDWAQLLEAQPARLDAYSGPGSATSMLASRLSYDLDLRGPSVTVDTACSGALVAIHLACQSLRLGEAEMALVGAVNLLLLPGTSTFFSKAGMLAPDGRCKSFDHRADGLVRSDGAAMFVLKPLAAALASGDPIHAVIRGSAVNQNGRSDGILSPSGAAQEAVLRQAYLRAGVAPSRVQYIEAHGVGTRISDSIEARALGNVLCEGREPGRTWRLGCIKTNIGHSEAAAGAAGILKVALAMRRRQIPPNLHFERPSPLVPLADMLARVPERLEPWPENAEVLLAGVSSFGLGGTNAHVVLEEPPPAAPTPSEPHFPFLLPLSARTEVGLRELARAFRERLEEAGGAATFDATNLSDLVYTAQKRRTHDVHRLAVLGDDIASLTAALTTYLVSPRAEGTAPAGHAALRRPRIVFVFLGEERVDEGLVAALRKDEPAFLSTFERCEALGAPRGFCMQAALAAMWRSRGVEPTAVVGEGSGELVAAVVASAIRLEDAAALAPRSGLDLARALAAIRVEQPDKVLLLPSFALEPLTREGLAAARAARGADDPSRVSDALARLFEAGESCLLAIGEAPNLEDAVRRAEQLTRTRATVLSIPCRDADVRRHVLGVTGALYSLGHAIRWGDLPPRAGRCVPLPSQPWQRERFWITPKPAEPAPSPGPTPRFPSLDPRQDGALSAAPSSPAEAAASLRDQLAALDPTMRAHHLQDLLRQLLGDVLMLLPELLAPELPLRELGIDSILLAEIGARIQAATGVELAMTYMLEGPALTALSGLVLERMGLGNSPEP